MERLEKYFKKGFGMINQARRLCFAMFFVTIFISPAISSVLECGDYANSIRWGNNHEMPDYCTCCPGDFALEWPLVYYGNPAGFYVTDISDLNHPQTTKIMDSGSFIFRKNGDFVLISLHDSRIVSLDFTDPFHPVSRDTLDLPLEDYDDVRDIGLTDGRAYIGCAEAGILVVDTSDPDNLQLSGAWSSPEELNNIDVYNNTLYVCDIKGLHVLSLSDQDRPQTINSLSNPAVLLARKRGLLAVSGYYSTNIFNTGDPENLNKIACFDVNTYRYNALSDGLLATSSGERDIDLFQINQVGSSEKYVAIGNGYGGGGSFIMGDNLLVTGNGHSLVFYELNNEKWVEGKHKSTMPFYISDVEFDNGFVFVAAGDAGLAVCQIPETGPIEVVTELSLFGRINKIELTGNLALVAGYKTWGIVDVADPMNPNIIGQAHDLPRSIGMFVVHGAQLFLISDYTLMVYDFSNPLDIHLVNSFFVGAPKSLIIDNDFLYLGPANHIGNRMDIYSLDGASLELQSSTEMDFGINSITVKDDLAIINFWGHQHTYDVSDPTNPVYLNESITWAKGDIRFTSKGLVISDEYSLRFCNIDDNHNVENIGSFWWKEWSKYHMLPDGSALVWYGKELQLAPAPCSWIDEETIYLSAPKNIMTISPNPFNPSTILKFSLPEAGFCSMEIYDLKGRLVNTLCQENLSSGGHELTWHGKDDSGRITPAGIYFARLKHKAGVEIQKMILLK